MTIEPGQGDVVATGSNPAVSAEGAAVQGRKTPGIYWLWLLLAIVSEVIATTLLKSTEGFTRLWPSVIVICCYEVAFILLAVSVRRIAVGVVYALWSGVGVALVTLVAWIGLEQPLDTMGLVGVGLIIAGVVVMQGFSKTTHA